MTTETGIVAGLTRAVVRRADPLAVGWRLPMTKIPQTRAMRLVLCGGTGVVAALIALSGGVHLSETKTRLAWFFLFGGGALLATGLFLLIRGGNRSG